MTVLAYSVPAFGFDYWIVASLAVVVLAGLFRRALRIICDTNGGR